MYSRRMRMTLEEIVDEVLSKSNSLITGVIPREENGKRAYKIHIGSKCGDGFLYENEHGEVVLEGRYQEIDTINYCLDNNIKVIIILEPLIKPLHTPLGTGFRDIKTGFISSKCHEIQQQLYFMYLMSKYRDNKNVKILDMRRIFENNYEELFYDECHLNAKGNYLKAAIIYKVLDQLFP